MKTLDELRATEDDLEEGAAREPFSAREAIYRLETLFSEIRVEWPEGVPLDDLIEWLDIKLKMTRQEANCG